MGVIHAAAEPGSTTGGAPTESTRGPRSPRHLNGAPRGWHARFGELGCVGALQFGKGAPSFRGETPAPPRCTCTGWSSGGNTCGEAVNNGRAPGPLLSRAARSTGGGIPRDLASATNPATALARARCSAPARLHLASSGRCCHPFGQPGLRHGRRTVHVATAGCRAGSTGSCGRSAALICVWGGFGPAACRRVPEWAVLGCCSAARGSAGRPPGCRGPERSWGRGRSCAPILRGQPFCMTGGTGPRVLKYSPTIPSFCNVC